MLLKIISPKLQLFVIQLHYNRHIVKASSIVQLALHSTSAFHTTMSSTRKHFTGKPDHYNGITVDSTKEPCDSSGFYQCLKDSMSNWQKDKKRAIWFRVHLSEADWIATLAKEGFVFHHARREFVMMYKWISKEEDSSNIPPYAHTNIGIGSVVFNESTREILVIKEKYSSFQPMWKLPGGLVEPVENIEDAAVREVLEETGVEAKFVSLLAFRHGHHYAFDCSDIYFIAYLEPKTLSIKSCQREISECMWMKLDEYVTHPEVHENNKLFAQQFIKFLDIRHGMVPHACLHPITKKPTRVYAISDLKATSKDQ